MARDRRSELIKSATLNGIDFVEIATEDQKTLRVHFLNAVAVKGSFQDKDVSITGGETIVPAPVLHIDEAHDWSTDGDGNPVLTLRVAAPGDFSAYTLSIDSPKLDRPYFSQSRFSFKARCKSTLDCQAPAPACPSGPGELPPIDYQAKDFLSFRKALLDFSALRYPDWVERSEADFGVMTMEALAALADDLSYMQDRVAAEAAIETATERRSLVRHARLVDYEPAPATSARVMLQFEMKGAGGIPAGLLLSAASPDGAAIYFETGKGLADNTLYPADERWNGQATAYYFDDSQQCLKAGATSMYVEGHGWGFCPDQLLLIETAGATTADPPHRQIVKLISKAPVSEDTDQVFPAQITRIEWRKEDALKEHRDLANTKVKGNLIPATQGRRYTESFAVAFPPPAFAQLPRAVCRTGPNGTPAHLYSLLRSGPPSPLAGNSSTSNGLAWLQAASGGGRPTPEIRLTMTRPGEDPLEWTWVRWLLDAGAFDPAFTVDPVHYTRLAINSDRTAQMDYDGDQGDTIRFGDGTFGDIPEEDAVFTVSYRVGGGRAGNVAPDTTWRIEAPSSAIRASNPFPAEGGADAETPLSIVRQAPEAFRATQFRAVLREDYQAAAQTLDWVQRAGTAFRWTGSWMTVFTTPDPKNSLTLGDDQRVELIDLLNRYRLAGYESYAPLPRYAALDLKIAVCARADAFRGDVEAAILTALSTAEFPDGSRGFFHPDNFTFGQALDRGALEAAIQRAPGVGGVISVLYRRRGHTKGYVNMPGTVTVGSDEIFLLANDPSRPERGSLKITVEGGK